MRHFFIGLSVILATMFSALLADAKPQAELTDTQKSIIVLILQNTNEVYIHQMNGAKDNQVFLSEDGHKEAVYDVKGKLVQDGVNDGSYNYHHPKTEPVLHFANDILPWISYGSSRADPTSVKERKYAYMGDLEGGIRRALQQYPTLEPSTHSYSDTENFVFALWNTVIQKGRAEILFSYFERGRPMTDAETLVLMKALNKGFKRAF